MSLERKLPLLMTAVLLVILGGGVLLAYREIRRAAEILLSDRMQDFTDALAAQAAGTPAGIGDRLRVVARNPVVRRVLTSPAPSRSDLARATRLLAELQLAADSGMISELWSSDGRVIASYGGPRVGDARPATAAVVTGPDSLSMGALYAAGGRVYYWDTRPVVLDGVRIGTIAQRRRLNAEASIDREIQSLAGEAVNVLLRNADGSMWTTLGGQPVDPPADRQDLRGMRTYLHAATVPDERVVMFEKAVERTPWVVVLELPVNALSHGPLQLLRRFAVMSVLLLLAGAIGLWLVGRRITRPLARLTSVAEAIAKGDYSQRVKIGGDYEIARLGVSFNRMAGEIAHAHKQLQASARDAAVAQQAAETANASKSNFLAAMSHELRTPLNAIAGYVELLELELRGPVTEQQRTDLSRIKRSQKYLLGLIEEILVFSQLDAQRLDFNIRTVAVDAVVRDAEAMVDPQIRSKGIDYRLESCDPRITVLADSDKLQQVLINLLVNATKFTDEGGTITISCETDDVTVKVRVADTGVGIPEEKLSHIFDAFVQLDRSLNRPREGVGLGLTISRELTRAMGGDLSVDSAVGQGSTFTITLPAGERLELFDDLVLQEVDTGETAPAQGRIA